MKKKYLVALLAPLLLASCNLGSGTSDASSSNSITTSTTIPATTSEADPSATTTATPSNTSVVVDDDTVDSEFSVVGDDNQTVTVTDKVYKITAAGTYNISGKLEEGQIYVDVADGEVELVLEGVSITNSSKSPIYVNDSSDVTIKVKNKTTNYIYDTRSTDYSDSTDETVGDSAIYVSNGDLKINGKGTLYVYSYYNSAIHGKDNVTVKNATLVLRALNNGIKGNDKVTIEENPTLDILAGNNGIITSNSDMGSKNQHGYIYINGGSITINSDGDGIDAAYAVVFGTSQDDEGITYEPTVDIYTNIYSTYSENISLTSYTDTDNLLGGPGGGFPGGGGGGGFPGGSSAEKADDSAKAIKANEAIDINAGIIYTYTYDDSLHTNNDTLDTGSIAKANITINGGTLNLKASDDAIHADGTLTINGGTVNVIEAHEGLEGNIINITGGNVTVVGNDDGINASSQINISGGRVDVTVSPNGDTDGIDSNGTITISGGVIITRGPNSEMAAPIDADGQMKMTGGTLIVLGYSPRRLSVASSLVKTSSTSGLSSGSHTVTIGSTAIEYTNSYTYSGAVTVYASSSATIK